MTDNIHIHPIEEEVAKFHNGNDGRLRYIYSEKETLDIAKSYAGHQVLSWMINHAEFRVSSSYQDIMRAQGFVSLSLVSSPKDLLQHRETLLCVGGNEGSYAIYEVSFSRHTRYVKNGSHPSHEYMLMDTSCTVTGHKGLCWKYNVRLKWRGYDNMILPITFGMGTLKWDNQFTYKLRDCGDTLYRKGGSQGDWDLSWNLRHLMCPVEDHPYAEKKLVRLEDIAIPYDGDYVFLDWRTVRDMSKPDCIDLMYYSLSSGKFISAYPYKIPPSQRLSNPFGESRA